MNGSYFSIISALIGLPFLNSSDAADWPQWRYDAKRTASSPEQLPDKLALLWTRKWPARIPAWENPLNRDKMTFDRHFEPIVIGERIFFAFNDGDRLLALNAETGKEIWTYFADGPIRLPPAGWNDNIFVASDDGYLHCVDAASGELRWKYRGGPSAQKTLGNRRVISMWPARGGPVISDGRVYFAASIWPFLGTFIYALNAESGKVEWINDSTGPTYSMQPHGASAFGGVAPQGALVAADDLLLVPGGRSLPAAFNRQTGKLSWFFNSGIVGGKGVGGSFVAANKRHLFVHTRKRGTHAFTLEDEKKTEIGFNGEPVLDGETIYAAGGRAGKAYSNIIECVGQDSWKIEVDGSGDLIRVGRHLYAAGADFITAIELPEKNAQPSVAWRLPVRGVVRLLAASEKLFAVTLDGQVMAFGTNPRVEGPNIHEASGTDLPAKAEDRKAVSAAVDILKECDTHGYAIMYGSEDGVLLNEILRQSKLTITVVDTGAASVAQSRQRYARAGLYGKRVSVHVGSPSSFKAPPFIASLVIVGKSQAAELSSPDRFNAVFRSVRPYGGVVWIAEANESVLDRFIASQIGEKIVKKEVSGGWMLVRTGAPAGSADWTHQYGNIGNTGKSDDRRVKLPLGVLWFGGNSNEDTRIRPAGPAQQVVGGRLFVPGVNGISARDVYTGRVLWRAEFNQENLEAHGAKLSGTLKDLVHEIHADPYRAYKPPDIYQANTRGTNFVATEDFVYVALLNTCAVYEAATGKLKTVFQLPSWNRQDVPPDWGYIGVYENILLGGWGFADFSLRLGNGSTGTADKYASRGLAALDRRTGRVLWKVKARHSFIHNGIVAGNGRVYCLDKLPALFEKALKRRGLANPSSYRIAALDVKTGRQIWQKDQEIFGTWLSYSSEHDILLQAIDHGPARIDRRNRGKGMAAFAGKDGRQLWKQTGVEYFGPCIIHDKTILTVPKFYDVSAGAFSLLDGSPVLVPNPLTGQNEPWSISRGYGCNSLRASEHLLTYRSGSAAYYDLSTKTGTGTLGGFRSGCASNLIIANGVLNAPEFTRHCICNFQNQTSLALVHMPDIGMESWTCKYGPLNPMDFSDFEPQKISEKVRRIGINFGAPGDRMSEEGTLWLDYPDVGGSSFSIPIEVKGEVHPLRRHNAFIKGTLPWVSASSVAIDGSIDLDLNPAAEKAKTRRFTIRLYFAELEPVEPGKRVFDVALQGKKVLDAFDIVKAAGRNTGTVKTFKSIPVERHLTISLKQREGSLPPVICGVEAVEERGR